MPAPEKSEAPRPLTALTEDEKLFQSTVRKFAREQIRPYVREMDEAGVFRKDIMRQFFEMGLMGIEIPEEYGGQGGTFFQAILAVEELSAVDPSAGVIVDVQNTICNNALLRWANAEQKTPLPAAAGGRHGGVLCAVGSRLRLGRLRPGHARGGPGRPFPAQRPQTVDHQCRRGRPVPAVRQRRSRRPDTRASRRSWWSAISPASRWARRKTSSACAPPPPAS